MVASGDSGSDCPSRPLHEQGLALDGRRLFLGMSGSNRPTVVILPGAGLVGLDYLVIHERVAAFATSVIYDRGGTGWSDGAELPRSAETVAGELRALLTKAGATGPYVLVGHSLGAFYARRYAQLYPQDVAGLVLLDPGHEDIFDFLPPGAAEMSLRMKQEVSALQDLTDTQISAARAQFETLYTRWPAEVREALIEHHLTHWRTGLAETANLETDVYAELREGGALPDAPLILLTAKGHNPFWQKFLSPGEMQVAMDGVAGLHAAMAASTPRGEHRELEGASHQYLHIEQPDAIIAAIRDVIARID